MKIKELSTACAVFPAPERFCRTQFTRGLPLSLAGVFVYLFLRLIGKKPLLFHGVCRYFVIGENWGGFSMGWFFVCCRRSDERLMRHELGHCVENATIGGFRMLGYSMASALRFWGREIKRKCRRSCPPYENWWFEKQASLLGHEYVRRLTGGNP